jgi:hypothetical protein
VREADQAEKARDNVRGGRVALHLKVLLQQVLQSFAGTGQDWHSVSE